MKIAAFVVFLLVAGIFKEPLILLVYYCQGLVAGGFRGAFNLELRSQEVLHRYDEAFADGYQFGHGNIGRNITRVVLFAGLLAVVFLNL